MPLPRTEDRRGPQPVTAPAPPEAVLWDMDGTLVDSEPYWIATERELAEAAGGTWSHEQALGMVGQPITFTARSLRDQAGVPGTDDEIAARLVARVAERIRQDGPPWRPGARELLESLGAAGIPSALVTMSYREMAQAVLEVLPAGTFAAVVTGDEVTHGKPHPEPYLLAARMLGVDITRCVAIEDSIPGVASAQTSGAATIAVPLMVEIPKVPGLTMLTSLDGVTIDDLARITGGETQDRRSEA